MLILTRSEGQSVILDGDIRVTIQKLGETQVKLSIEAPDEVDIVREELLHNSPSGMR